MIIQLESFKIKNTKKKEADSFIELRSIITEIFIMTIKWGRVNKFQKKTCKSKDHHIDIEHPLSKIKPKTLIFVLSTDTVYPVYTFS